MQPGKREGGRGWPVAWNSAARTNPSERNGDGPSVCRLRLFADDVSLFPSFGLNCNLFSWGEETVSEETASPSRLFPSPRLCNTDVDSHTGGIQLFLLSRNRRSPRNLTFFLPLPFLRFGNETVGERIKRDGIRANVEIETKISSKRRSGPWFVPGLFRQIEITSRKRWARIDVASQ